MNFYAEFDTDKIIREKYFQDFNYQGIIIEVGAATPEFLSVTKHFKESGWRCVHIEPNPEFVKLHQEEGNEIYQYACGEEDINDVDFTVVSMSKVENKNQVSDHSFSSFSVKPEYVNLNDVFYNSLSKKIIKVNCRRLDTIIKDINIQYIDILSIDTEGWELEVMNGLSLIDPKLIILENVLHLELYNIYMIERGYKLVHKQEHNYFYEKIN